MDVQTGGGKVVGREIEGTEEINTNEKWIS